VALKRKGQANLDAFNMEEYELYGPPSATDFVINQEESKIQTADPFNPQQQGVQQQKVPAEGSNDRVSEWVAMLLELGIPPEKILGHS